MNDPAQAAPSAAPTPRPQAKPPAKPQAKPRVAFDPLDPQWQAGARVSSPPASTSEGSEPAASTSSTSGAVKTAPPAPVLSAEEARRKEQADAVVMGARRAFARSEARAAGEQIKQALAIDAGNASALELLGEMYLAEAEQEKAIQVFEKGRALHPHHVAFEEKIALALLDIEEEKRDREMAQLLLEQPDLDRWAERKPALAATLSLLVPGAGQFYNDQPERGAAFLGAALLSFGGWYWIFHSATSGASGRAVIGRTSEVIGALGGLAKLGFWLLMLAWLATVAFAAWDAYQNAVEANRARRPFEV